MHDDTIAAISTAPGRAAIAVVRISGPDSVAIARALLAECPPKRRATLSWVTHPETGERVDQVLVTRFPAPNSYTGEEMLELSCHGGILTPQLVLDAVLAGGARQAEPGEFTRRAYLNGKLDLLQAEAILDLIDGRSTAQHRAALHQLDRGLSRRIEELREAIVACEALLVYEIDFPEEDEGPVPPHRIDAAAGGVIERIDALLSTAEEGELIREGALTVVAGRPNAGKSSLFNALCGAERAIVTEEPGTTRDAVEAVVSLAGFPFRLVDTAGLRETEQPIERIGIEVAQRYLQGADVILFCAEAGRALEAEEAAFLERMAAKTVFLIRTKADLVSPASSAAAGEIEKPGPGSPRKFIAAELTLSALGGVGIADLRDALVESLFSGSIRGEAVTPLVTRRRHARGLRRAREEVAAFLSARSRGVPPEVAATHLRTAAHELEELLGVIAPDDLLRRVFEDFCIGK
jgi:tRNA modification GTPase